MPRTINVPSTPEAVAAAPLDACRAERRNGVVSPDGRWIAYEDVARGRQPDVWVRPLSGPGDRTVVSAGGGDQPRFTRGGRETVYRRGVSLFTAAFDSATGEESTPCTMVRGASRIDDVTVRPRWPRHWGNLKHRELLERERVRSR